MSIIINNFKQNIRKAFQDIQGDNAQDSPSTDSTFECNNLLEQVSISEDTAQVQYNYFKNKKHTADKCVVCKNKPKYTCPSCKARYCSVQHYKTHNLFCSEQFYQQEVERQLKNTKPTQKQIAATKQYLIKNKQHREEDQEYLIKQVEVQEIKEERLKKILQDLENEQAVSLTREQQLAFERYLKQIEMLSLGEESNLVADSDQSYRPYNPFWMIEDGLQNYVLIEPLQLEEYSKSNHKDLIDYRETASKIIRQEVQHISELVNVSKLSPLINIDLAQIIYLSCLVFRVYDGQYLNNHEFISTFTTLYNTQLTKNISVLFPNTSLQHIRNPLVLLNNQFNKLSNELLTIVKSWLPSIPRDCMEIIKNKYLLLELLLRMIESIRSVFNIEARWSDEALKKINKSQKKQSAWIVRLIKKMQFMMSYVKDVIFCSQDCKGEAEDIKYIQILNNIFKDLQDKQKEQERDEQNMRQQLNRQKQRKLNGIIIPK